MLRHANRFGHDIIQKVLRQAQHFFFGLLVESVIGIQGVQQIVQALTHQRGGVGSTAKEFCFMRFWLRRWLD